MERESNFEHEMEPKPGFSLIKYGNVYSLSCNVQFIRRMNNLLSECADNKTLTEMLANLQRWLAYSLNLGSEKPLPSNKYTVTRFEHVFTVTFGKDFAQELNSQLNSILSENQVSPPMFSFAKQLEGCLYPKRKGVGYADE